VLHTYTHVHTLTCVFVDVSSCSQTGLFRICVAFAQTVPQNSSSRKKVLALPGLHVCMCVSANVSSTMCANAFDVSTLKARLILCLHKREK